MAGAVLYVGDLVAVVGFFGYQVLQDVADGLYYFYVLLFVVAADVIGIGYVALLRYQDEGAGVVFHKQPVAYLAAVAVYRQGFAGQGVEDDQRDEFFREVVRAVVVAAVGDQRGQAVGALPGADEVV